jgi:5-hydroxytryptamine receptor 2
MSTMSVVRYMKIKSPLKYGLNMKSKRHTLAQIVFAWFVSFGVCSPLLVMGLSDTTNVYEESTSTCSLFNKHFRLYGSIFAFYIPFLVMLVAYVATIRALKRVLENKKKIVCYSGSASVEGGVYFKKNA